jgi:phage nucleotide-binding protein
VSCAAKNSQTSQSVNFVNLVASLNSEEILKWPNQLKGAEFMAKKLTDALKSAGVSAIIYGESGIGKTHFCGTLPGKTLIIAAEANGIKTLARSENLANIEVENLPEPGESQAETTSRYDKFFEQLLLTDLPYDNIVLDSATELANQLMINKTDLTKNGGAPAQHTYLEVQWAMRRYLRTLRDLAVLRNKNVIITALESELMLAQTVDGGASKLHPALTGKKLSPEAEGLFDIVGRIEKLADGTRYIRLEGNNIAVAKDRFGRKACVCNGKIFVSGETGKEAINNKEK